MSKQLFVQGIRDVQLKKWIDARARFESQQPTCQEEREKRLNARFFQTKQKLDRELERREHQLFVNGGILCETLKAMGYHNSSCRGRVPHGECGCVCWPDRTGPRPAWISPCFDYICSPDWPTAGEQVKQERRRQIAERTRDIQHLHRACKRYVQLHSVHVQDQEGVRGRQISSGLKRRIEEAETKSSFENSEAGSANGEHSQGERNVLDKTIDERVQKCDDINQWLVDSGVGNQKRLRLVEEYAQEQVPEQDGQILGAECSQKDDIGSDGGPVFRDTSECFQVDESWLDDLILGSGIDIVSGSTGGEGHGQPGDTPE